MEIKVGYDCIDWDQLIQLYKAVDGVIGLANAGEIDKIKRSFKKSYKIVTVWQDQKLVGAGRMISDGECYGWIHDVGVLPDLQKQGVGRRVMEGLMQGDSHLLIGLTSSFVAEDFYSRLGFKKHKTAMAKYPGKSDYLID